MILQPMSDLHADFPGFAGYPAPVPGASVIVVAGDTRQGLAAALRELRTAYPPPLEVVVVAGNHEFWSRAALPAAIEEGRRVAADLGLHYLENDAAVIGATGVRFLGCTLWSDYTLFGEASRTAAMCAAFKGLRDHKRIKWQSNPWARFRPQEARALNLKSREFLEDALSKPHDGPTVVVTHFAPALEAVSPAHRDGLLAASACTDMVPLVDRLAPAAWISGHMHFAYSMTHGRTRMLSNPHGYPDEHLGFDPLLIIEV
ncbi:metallophosphoesterase [Bradyrhizobium sp. USDA 223]|uniref:metallophosphoesterase n=1 Tax=Bradyrhizobium sp. USDA 223 TaxID=3156306 RepID=UPI00383938CC